MRQASSAARAGADAVSGGELEVALREVAPQLERRLVEFTDACSQWSFDLEASVAAYEETDAASGAALRGLAGRSV